MSMAFSQPNHQNFQTMNTENQACAYTANKRLPASASGFSIFAVAILILAGCVSAPTVKVSAPRGAKVGVFWFSGLNGDQASTAVTRELINSGFNVVDTANFNQTVHRLGANPSQISADSLNKLRGETGVEFMLVGSSVALPGILNFSHAGMAVSLIDMRAAQVIWKEKYGNPIWTGVLSTTDDIEKGATLLVSRLDAALGERIQGGK